MNPATMHVKTNLLAREDIVVYEGEFWSVKAIELTDERSDIPWPRARREEMPELKHAKITLVKGDKTAEVIDSKCRKLGPVHSLVSDEYKWWRVVNVGG